MIVRDFSSRNILCTLIEKKLSLKPQSLRHSKFKILNPKINEQTLPRPFMRRQSFKKRSKSVMAERRTLPRRNAAPLFEELREDYEGHDDDTSSESEDNIEREDSNNDDEDEEQQLDEDEHSTGVPRDAFTQEDFFFGRNGYQWSRTPPESRGRHASHNVMTEAGRLLVPGTPSIKETFSLFCGGKFLEKTVFFTNRFANSYIEQNPGGWYACRWKDTDDTEMEAFFGTLLFIEVFRGRNENCEDLWSDEYGRPQLKAAMSLSRFKMLMKFLRFDERRTRPERKKEDKLAAIRIL